MSMRPSRLMSPADRYLGELYAGKAAVVVNGETEKMIRFPFVSATAMSGAPPSPARSATTSQSAAVPVAPVTASAAGADPGKRFAEPSLMATIILPGVAPSTATTSLRLSLLTSLTCMHRMLLTVAAITVMPVVAIVPTGLFGNH
eukprot:Amastigsp_a841513_98.p4 type:complete len:145 gc:universal Amastigsp_a841513_98:1933-2367(+)